MSLVNDSNVTALGKYLQLQTVTGSATQHAGLAAIWAVDNSGTPLVTIDRGLQITGTLAISSITEVGSDTDKFLCSDGGTVKYVDGANLATYIGAVSTAANSTFTGNNTFSGKLTGSNGIKISDNASNSLALDNTNGLVIVGNAAITGTLNVTGLITPDGHIIPDDDALSDLGSTTNGFNDLHLGSGGIINFNNSDVTMTHSSNRVTVTGGSTRVDKLEIDGAANSIDVSTDLLITAAADISFAAGGSNVKPSSNDGATLGVSGSSWSDLFLADGATMVFNAGGANAVTVTHGDNQLALDSSSDIKAKTFITYSDATLKTDIKPLSNALEKVMAMRGVSYEFKKQTSIDAPPRREVGFLAQEMQSSVPEVVYGSAAGDLGIDYAKLTSVLVEAIKDQQSQIEDLRAALLKK